MNKITYIFLFAILLFAACSADDIPHGADKEKQIELRLTIKGFEGESVTRAGFDATEQEKQIDNLCLFIQSGTTLHKYYMTATSFTGGSGSWEKDNNKILLGLTAAQVGTADVYVVANAGDITSSITSVADLQSKKVETANPWSNNITTPLIMSGSVAGHNFTTTPILNTVPLYRAVAKVEFEITLSEQYQSTPTVTNPHDANDIRDQYKYQFLNFNKNTSLLDGSGTESLFSDGEEDWRILGKDNGLITPVINNEDKVTILTFTTYINERNGGDPTTIMLQLPFWDAGMPPPQFLEEGYPVKLPTVIERNHYYKVAVSL